MSDQLHVPHRVKILGVALCSTLQRLERAMRQPVRADHAVYGMLETVSHHLRVNAEGVRRLSAGIDTLMAEVISLEAASDVLVYRAVGRFDACMDDLLDGLKSVQTIAATGDDLQACSLLEGAYRHLLGEVRDWLSDLIDAIDDPLAALNKRGLPTTGSIKLPIILKLTPAPQLERLRLWGQGHGTHLPAAEKERLGFWHTAGQIALGVALGNCLFG